MPPRIKQKQSATVGCFLLEIPSKQQYTNYRIIRTTNVCADSFEK